VKDIISRLQVKYNATNGSLDPTNHPAMQVPKVEIVDGSEVLYSISARQIEALMFYNLKKSRARMIEYRNGNENFMTLDMLFGRKLYDPLLAFDPNQFRNPQLKITHAKALGGCAPSASTLEVFADLFDEKVPSPIGYIMPKQYKTYTTPSAPANEYTDLPNDYPIKRILIQTYKSGLWWDNIVSEVELNEEEGKRKPWDVNGYDIMMTAMTQYGAYFESFIGQLVSTTANRFFITPNEEYAIGWITYGSQRVYLNSDVHGCECDLVATGSANFRANVQGPIPHGAVPLDCGDQQDPEDWYDVTTKGKVKLRLKAGAATTVNVVLEQLRRY